MSELIIEILTYKFEYDLIGLMLKNNLILPISSVFLFLLEIISYYYISWFCYSGKKCFILGNSIYHWQEFIFLGLIFLILGFVFVRKGRKSYFKIPVFMGILIILISLLSILNEIFQISWQMTPHVNLNSYNQILIDYKNHFSFKYPSNSSASLNEDGFINSAVIIKTGDDPTRDVSLCAFSTNEKPLKNPDKLIEFNGIKWQKKLFFGGEIYAFEGFKWQTRLKDGRYLTIETDPIAEKLCEGIIRNFKFIE